ncbi:response regulator, partial [Halorubrum pallidum]
MTTYPPSPPTDDRATASQGRGETDPIEILHVEPSSRVAELLAAFADQAPDRFVVRSVDRVTAAMESVEDADCVVTEQRLPDGTGVELLGHV